MSYEGWRFKRRLSVMSELDLGVSVFDPEIAGVDSDPRQR